MKKGLTIAFSITAAAASLFGCGGGGGGSSTSTSATTAANSYTYSQTLAALPIASSSIVTGIGPNDEWLAVPAGLGVPSPTYYINEQPSTFPINKVVGTGAGVTFAGGNFVWASSVNGSGQLAASVLNRLSGSIAQFQNARVFCTSPNGQVAFAQFTQSQVSYYGLLSADGSAKMFRPVGNEGYVGYAVSNTGWSVVYSDSFEYPTLENGPEPADVGVTYLVSPQGTFTKLQAAPASILSVNDSGVCAGGDTITGRAVTWDQSGKETALKQFAPGNTERALSISDSGVIVGYSKSPNDSTPASYTTILWQPNGEAVNLSAKVSKPNGVYLTQASFIQNSGQMLGHFSTDQGTSFQVPLIPSK